MSRPGGRRVGPDRLAFYQQPASQLRRQLRKEASRQGVINLPVDHVHDVRPPIGTAQLKGLIWTTNMDRSLGSFWGEHNGGYRDLHPAIGPPDLAVVACSRGHSRSHSMRAGAAVVPCGAGYALDGGVDGPIAPMRMSALAARASMGSCACQVFGDALGGRRPRHPIPLMPAPIAVLERGVLSRADEPRCRYPPARGSFWSSGSALVAGGMSWLRWNRLVGS
jgi:hypothetical protein